MGFESDKSVDLNHLELKISSLEQRIFNIESELGISHNTDHAFADSVADEDGLSITKKNNDSGFGLESTVGSFGLALLGNIVFLFGIIFLSQYIHNNGFPIASTLFGYIATAGIFLLARFAQKRVSHLSSMFNIIGQFLLYYITLRLHFFIDNPVITNKALALVLIFIVVLSQLALAFRKKSELYAGIAIVLTLVTGVISDNSFVILILGPFISAISILLFYKFDWKRILSVSLFLVYLVFVAWFLRNPLSAQLIQSGFHQYCFGFLLASAAIFSLICFAPNKGNVTKHFILTSVLINGINFSLVLALFVSNYLINSYTGLFIFISVYCLTYSILLKSRSVWKFTPAFYALYGFVAMSVSVYGYYKLPYTFLLLSLQSLLVLAYAVWFRSKIIVNMNTVLFVMLLLTYLFSSGLENSINFSFSFAAIISIIVIDWKKQALKIDSAWLPNIYLVIFFVLALFSLYKSLPPQYITLSWTIAAIIYFIYSIITHKVKFRWMAIFTMISAAFYLFLVDLSRISLAYRIIAFLFLAMISIGISLFYSKSKKPNDNTLDENLN